MDAVTSSYAHLASMVYPSGLDGVPMGYLCRAFYFDEHGRPCGHLLSEALAAMFNRVLREGYPKGWKAGALVPVPKPRALLSTAMTIEALQLGLHSPSYIL